MTARNRRPRVALRRQPRSHARSPEVCPRGDHRVDAHSDTTRRRRPDRLDRASITTTRTRTPRDRTIQRRIVPSPRRADLRRRTYASRGQVVIIQEATESCTPTDPTLTWNGHDALDQRIAQPLMIAFVMIVRDVLGHGLPKVPLAERKEAIQTFMFDRPNEALSMRIRIRRPPRGLHNADATRAQQLPYRRVERAPSFLPSE